MGQKANPIGNRLGIIRGWESNWYGNKKDFAAKLIEDNKIRTYLNARINKGGISKIVIERTLGKLIITIHTSKPGIIIGKGGMTSGVYRDFFVPNNAIYLTTVGYGTGALLGRGIKRVAGGQGSGVSSEGCVSSEEVVERVCARPSGCEREFHACTRSLFGVR